MLNPHGTRAWYGVLETSQGRTPVIYDPRLQPAPKGRVFLYNMDRDAIVTYDWSIVSQRLREVDDVEAPAIRRAGRKKLASAREQFLAARGHRTPSTQSATAGRREPLPEIDDDPWESALLDDIDFK